MDGHLERTARKRVTWQRHVDAWSRSGLSQRSYCESRDLSLSTFQLWRRRLAGAGDAAPRPECVELVPVPREPRTDEPISGRPASVVLCVRHYRIEVGDDASRETLRRVLDAVEAR